MNKKTMNTKKDSRMRGLFRVLIAVFWAYLSVLGSWPEWWLYEYPVEPITQFFGAFIFTFLVVRFVDRRFLIPRKKQGSSSDKD